MFRTLYSKLATALLGLFVLVGAIFVFLSVYSTEMYQKEVNQKLNLELARLIVAEKIIMQNNRINDAALKDIFHMLMVINPSIEIYLLDPEGKILSFSAEPGKVKRSKVDVEPLKKFLEGGAVMPLMGDDPRDSHGKKVFTAARIPRKGRLEGYLYVILGGEIYDSVIRKMQGSYILRLSMWVIAASVVIAVLAGLIIFACLTRRLKHLTKAIESYKSGVPLPQLDLPEIPYRKPSDEIDSLILTFRQMATRIEEQVKSLKEVDTLRRDLVANVSHDLRTPLATLQGYVETLLMKDGSLSPEERRTYLMTAIRHCQRLGNLVSDLFELAKLEANDTKIHSEPFSIGELLQDVVQKFRLLAEEKKVDIVTNIGRELPFVNADIALIERVLENLIDNALYHTPEGGSVSVVLSLEQEKISVHVSDTGHGIPESEKERIFERFYRIDQSRKGRSDHSGLGLAITKRILELHKSPITVDSTLNVGSTFSFTLSVHR
jgi:signal transduction histidine kinase